MTIHLPKDIERSIEAAVHGGHFASLDEAMAEAARLLLRTLPQNDESSPVNGDASAADPVLGLMRNDADLMDEIVADAYRQRREESWREVDF